MKIAHRFYFDVVKPSAPTYPDAVSLMDKEFSSVLRQTKVKTQLAPLRMDHLIDGNTDAAAAYMTDHKLILPMSRQAPPSHEGDAHEIEILCGAAIGVKWAKEPLSRIATTDFHSKKYIQS